jgi:hypothetical protein
MMGEGGNAMEEIMEHFGQGFLQIAGGLLFFGIFMTCMHNDGTLFAVMETFMQGLCG